MAFVSSRGECSDQSVKKEGPSPALKYWRKAVLASKGMVRPEASAIRLA